MLNGVERTRADTGGEKSERGCVKLMRRETKGDRGIMGVNWDERPSINFSLLNPWNTPRKVLYCCRTSRAHARRRTCV